MSSNPILNLFKSIMDLVTLIPPWCLSHAEPLHITREFFISCPNSHMMVKVNWPSLCSYMTSLPYLMRKMDFLINRLAWCLHTHFANPHNDGVVAYQLTTCTHLGISMISSKIISIILIQNILNKNCYNKRRISMNCLWNFGSASVICIFKLQKSKWNLLIFGIDSSIGLTNQSIPRGSLSPSLTQHTSVMELRNHRWTQSLSQVNVCRPLIKQLHHCRVMQENRHTHLFNCHIFPKSLHLIFAQTWFWVHWVVIWILYHSLRLHTRIILPMILSYVLPF